MNRKYLGLILVLASCRSPLPAPRAPLASTPEASFRNQPPAPPATMHAQEERRGCLRALFFWALFLAGSTALAPLVN